MLLAFAQQLLDVNPRVRPELNELRVIHGPTKRKSTRTQHEHLPKRHAVCLLSNFDLIVVPY